MRAENFIHLTSGSSSADHVQAALRALGRSEKVLCTIDGLSIGPLRDVDAGGASRVRWWSFVEGKTVSSRYARGLDDSRVWRFIRESPLPVVIWHSPFPTERLLALRACWFLRKEPQRAHEVRLPPNTNPNLRPFYGAVGIASPAKLVEAWPTHRRIRNVAGYARRWIELRSRKGSWIRHVERDRNVELPMTAYDDSLVVECRGDWRSSTLVIAHVLANNPCGTSVLAWRIRELLAAGRLEGRGKRTEFRLPAEVRPGPSPSQGLSSDAAGALPDE